MVYLYPPLLDSPAKASCRATVIIPARNEEHALPAALQALRLQIGEKGRPLQQDLYEVIVLLNNCTDSSANVVRRCRQQYPAFQLHVADLTLRSEEAHVGTARRMLMDTAFHRLQHSLHPTAAILSTDADTNVAPDWIYRNLRALEAGADAVGGAIHLKPQDIAHLDPGTLHAYRQDRRYQRKVAQLESLLDPDPADPWPRHLQHYGASLACTPAIYALAGGLPPVTPLEDIAFIHALRRIGARIRHAPDVSILTSARLTGRAEIGLSGQLRRWKEDAAANRPHLVQSAAYLIHRFTSLARLRQLWAMPMLSTLKNCPPCWREPLLEFHRRSLSQTDFLAAVDCNRLIDETFQGAMQAQIHCVIAQLDCAVARASTIAPEHPAETAPAASIAQYSTPAG